MSLSPGPSSSASFTMSLDVSPSTAVSSPPVTKIDEEEEEPSLKPTDEDDEEARWARLEYLLEKSAVYSGMLKERMDLALNRQRQLDKEVARSDNEGEPEGIGKKRHLAADNTSSSTSFKRKKMEDGSATDSAEAQKPDYKIFEQPRLVSGTKLKDYQLEGVAWMAGLHENGISGILADEMGLGKTLQTIAFAAYLRGRMSKPFLVVCPLSVLYNWISEFKKFAPEIPVCMYHGTPAERADIRQVYMDTSLLLEDYHEDGRRQGDTFDETRSKGRGQRGKAKGKNKGGKKRAPRKISKPVDLVNDESADKEPIDPGLEPEEVTHQRALKNKFPVVVTTYEMIMKDRAHLSHYRWGFIVVDEGHRLKNMDCKLMQEIKRYESAGRMVLTGTPLHNNLAELWSLMNFILPDIFHDLDSFQEWFNLPTLQTSLPSSRSTMIISTLQAIIKPFLLRRLKADVEKDTIPPKKEYVIYAPLTETQREIYDSIVEGELRAYLLKTQRDKEETKAVSIDQDAPMELRSAKWKGKSTKGNTFDILDGDDEEYFELLESGKLVEMTKNKTKVKDVKEAGREYHNKVKLKKVNNMKLQNTVMQLRKVCSHPFLFDWPVDPDSRQPIVDENLVNASGKMMLLERLLDELFARGHKVLLFSQFTMMLDIIEDWALEFKGWKMCRIDGSTSALDRREQVETFQEASEDSPNLFLLSTRAGGMGLNLTAADTVIFYDQDWNPQMDLQAQDRCHRIGQTKPVLVFRLVTAHTIETKIMQRATEKRQLEALVIAKGKFRMPALAADKPAAKKETMAKMAADLLRLEGEQIQIVPSTAAGKKAIALSDEELNMLMDRNLVEMANRGTGWNSAGARAGATKKAAFAVFNAPPLDQESDVVSNMMGESMDN